MLGLADFPIWLTIKMKMLFEIASLYGADLKDYKERVYLLYIFQLTFSSQQHRRKVFDTMDNWTEEAAKLPPDIKDLDWRSFLHNQELDAVVLGDDFGKQMRGMFEMDLQGSEEITLQDWKKRSLMDRLKEFGARLWARWL